MDSDGEIVTQLGLLLTQMGYARRALEDIERATARYTGIAVNLGGSGRPFGAPPMLDGALKVYVVNLGDLLADRSGPGLLEGLLGGAGRFLGGLLGGAAGGVLSGLAFPYDLAQVAAITKSVDDILARLGSQPGSSAGGGGSTFFDHLDDLTKFVDKLGGLFGAASTAPPAKSGSATQAAGSDSLWQPQPWLGVFQALHRVIDDLTRLVPLVVGALADVLYRLRDIRIAVAGFLDFAVEGALLLRGVILVTALETIAAAADLAAKVLGIVGTASEPILNSMVEVVDALLDVGISGLSLVGSALKDVMDQLMVFLRDGIGNLLLFLGDTRVFRVIAHLVDVLPLVLPALLKLFDKALTPAETSALASARAVGAIPGPVAGFTGARGPIAPFPDLGLLAVPGGPLRTFQADFHAASGRIVTAVHTGITAAATASHGVAAAATTAVKGSDTALRNDLSNVAKSATQLSDAFATAEAAATAARPESGLAQVARAYEVWLGGDGMRLLLGAFNRELAASAGGPEGPDGLAGRITAGGAPPEATVKVGEVVVELLPATPQDSRPADDIEELHRRLRAHERSMEERRGTVPEPVP